MPVLISFLNATAGLAAAASGLIVDSSLLVAAGAMVAASGSVLTMAMCRAMNRRLDQVLWGADVAKVESIGEKRPTASEETVPEIPESDRWDRAMAACEAARSVIIVHNRDSRPGYSGVPNLLYERPNAVLLWGDARENLNTLMDRLRACDAVPV